MMSDNSMMDLYNTLFLNKPLHIKIGRKSDKKFSKEFKLRVIDYIVEHPDNKHKQTASHFRIEDSDIHHFIAYLKRGALGEIKAEYKELVKPRYVDKEVKAKGLAMLKAGKTAKEVATLMDIKHSTVRGWVRYR